MTAPLFAFEGFGVTYAGGHAPALEDITLQLAPGRRLAIIGESGSGKSTFALALAGLLPAGARTTGRRAFPGFPTTPRPGRDIGMVFQDPGGSLDPLMPVGLQIAETIRAHQGLSWPAARTAAQGWLADVGLTALAARKYPHQFSGGQKQRIALAAALAAGPTLLIADEPTSALDTVTQYDILALLDRLTRERGLSLVFITHDIALASQLGDDLAVLLGGRLVEAGPTARVFTRPAHAYTRALLRSRLDIAGPRPRRLPEIDASDFSVRPAGAAPYG